MIATPDAQPRSAVISECPSCEHQTVADQPVLLMGLNDYLTHEIFDIFRCSGCGLQITRPLPAAENIGRYYPARYRGNRHAFTGGMRSYLRGRALESCFKRGFRGRLLDLGCGDGSFARHMLSRGWDVCATEIDPETVDRLRDAGINAKLSTTTQTAEFDKPFDAITTWHVLEHVEHPRQIVDWSRSHLTTNGIFQPTVPNVECLQARLFGRHWVHLDVPRHRQHFTPATLQALVESAGFKVQRRTNFALEYDWFGVIQSALNVICSRQNVLFDILTHAAPDPLKPTSLADKAMSCLLAAPIGAVALAVILPTAVAGDGATLTLTCR